MGHWELGTRRKTCFKFSPLVPLSPCLPTSPAPSAPLLLPYSPLPPLMFRSTTTKMPINPKIGSAIAQMGNF